RNFCIFPFRSENENPTTDYLSKGLAEVTFSSLNGFNYVFDPDPLVDIINHEYGNKKNEVKKKKTKKRKEEKEKPTLKELNLGIKKALIEEDPRYIKLKPKLIDDTPILLEEALPRGKKYGCYYILSGEYKVTGQDSLAIQFELTERRNGTVKRFSESTTIKRAFQEWQSRSGKLKNLLLNSEGAGITIKTGEEEGAYVYIDEEYAGKSPVTRMDVLAGKHKVLITREGFKRVEKVIELKKDKILTYNFPMDKIKDEGKISVSSKPSGAKVYLGSRFLGNTPIKDITVPLGLNRLKVEKEGFIDHTEGVEVTKGKTESRDVELKEGDTEIYYKNRFNVFLDYNYFDFSLYSLYGSLLFYGIFMYTEIRMENERDNLYSFLPVNYFSLLSTLQASSSDTETFNTFMGTLLYQQSEVDKTNRNLDRFQSIQNVSIGGFISMIALSGVFLYLGITSDALEFGFSPVKTPQGTTTEATIQYTFRF
ncbi:MAG: PEGA domain-containing protein, partial [Leptospiraceae bacterium]|nr:PEGA domain-containing protein [Leptospiraceae bacterium]